ncbi:alpha amylase [Candidatus Scalindua japonica]|uniref:Alpha amylase n=1 Tax=Candidatus Scalindua japonica TaxID=1284222 RepID=A0A286TYN1_9BACT|nr:alpha-amylase family glycosyl hydrolase [Candidatus Scalindua japonica]GAX60974.1 alpha amylase [Candidatus Scalindua japonica]
MTNKEHYIRLTKENRLKLIKESLDFIYSREDSDMAYEKILALINKYKQKVKSAPYYLTQKDIILITYGDQVFHHGETALATLYRFLGEYVQDVINTVHILPFYPYSSDDGFSIVNYKGVCPLKGSWKDIENIKKNHRIMFDGVINHMSQLSRWFNNYLAGFSAFEEFFIDVDPSTDLSNVVRPRTSPLLTEFIDDEGKIRNIWTTFGSDQVDLNYANYKVLLRVLDVLLFYIAKGASLIRLDAIAYIWKELGTPCVHLPRTHELIQLMREVMHAVAPEVIIITETNVPHGENISYFGGGDDEAQMVYNFALPPLLAFSILKSNTEKLTNWAKELTLPSNGVCFFNFTASHDGIGVRAVNGILDDKEMSFLVRTSIGHGGFASYRAIGDEEESPYELNCSYIDLLTHPEEDDNIRVKRMMLSQAVVLAMPGVPGVYFHSLVGSRNYHEAVKKTRINRSINRDKLNYDNLKELLEEEGSLQKILFKRYKQLLSIRINEEAFNPFGKYEFPDLGSKVFAIKRYADDDNESILALFNFTGDSVEITLPGEQTDHYIDIITHTKVNSTELTLEPYQIVWLKKHKGN